MFSWNIFNEDNIAKLVAENALCEGFVTTGSQLLLNYIQINMVFAHSLY